MKNNTLVVVADLACYKAYRLENHLHSSPRLELLEEYQNAAAHGKLVDKVTDLAGQFRRGPGATRSNGEQHNIQLENRRRLVRQLAQRLNKLASGPEVEHWLLAISKEINHQVMDELQPKVRAKIQKNVPADLTKIERSELLRHF